MSELNYMRNGDYLIPNLTLGSAENLPPLGKYGRMRKTYLKEQRPVLWNSLILNGKLDSHLREIDLTAQTRIEQMVPKMAMQAGIMESLKERDPMEWTRQMNSLKAQVEEVIRSELIFS